MVQKNIVVFCVFAVAVAGLYFLLPRLNNAGPEITAPKMRDINLFFYKPARDMDASGNVLCSRQGLVAMPRQIPFTDTPVQDAVNLLIAGQLSAAEKKFEVTTEFPLPGFELKGANLKDGTLTLEFFDPQNKTSGGACRAGILWFQIEATAKQFPGVNEVRFIPETLFQP